MSFRINQVFHSRFHSDAKAKLRLRNLKSFAIAALGTGANVALTQLPDLLHQVSHWTTFNRMLVPYLFLQGGLVTSVGLLGALKRTQSLKEIYSQINKEQAGKLNEPIKIAFIDSGIDRVKIPESIPLESCDQDGNSIEHTDPIGHGTTLALLTCEAFDRQGLSLISIQPYSLRSKSKDKYQETQEDYEQIFNGDTTNYGLEGAIDQVCTYSTETNSQSISSAIEKGAQVINISVGETLATIKGNISRWLNRRYDLCILAKQNKWDSVKKIDEQIKVILEALHKLKGDHPNSKIEDIDSQIITTYHEKAQEILHPILQEAENAKIPIVIAAENEFWGKTENHDFLCRVAHDTAFIIGSANSKGIVSAKSSHSNYLTVAGNGEGLQYQNFVEPNKLSLNWKIVFLSLTLLQKRYQELIPGSTSIAAADASTLIAQIRRINPNLSPSEIKAIICRTAVPSRFSFWRKLLKPEQNISHYSGAGLASRVAAIEEAKEQRVL